MPVMMQELVNAVAAKIKKDTKSGAMIQYAMGYVASVDLDSHMASIYIDGNTDAASQNFRIPIGWTLRIGDYVRCGIDYSSNLGKWVDEVMPLGASDYDSDNASPDDNDTTSGNYDKAFRWLDFATSTATTGVTSLGWGLNGRVFAVTADIYSGPAPGTFYKMMPGLRVIWSKELSEVVNVMDHIPGGGGRVVMCGNRL